MVSSQPLNWTDTHKENDESHISVDTVMRITRKHLCVWERKRAKESVCVCLCNYSLFNQANDCHATAQKPRGRNETEKNQSTGGRVKREEKVQQNRVEVKSSSEEWRDGWSQWAEGWKTNKEVIFALRACGKIQSTQSNSIGKNSPPLQGGEWLPIPLQHRRINEADKWLFSGHPDLATLSHLHHIG